MAKKVTIHLDALVVIVLLFLLSVGANLYLWRENMQLFKANVEVDWRAKDMEASWKYTQGLLKNCQEHQALTPTAEPLDQ